MKNLRNRGMFSQEEYVGKTLDEARKYAEEGGYTTRITEENGKQFMVTHDFMVNRVNLRVQGDFIIGAHVG